MEQKKKWNCGKKDEMFYFRCIELEAPNSDVWQAVRNEKPILRRKSRATM